MSILKISNLSYAFDDKTIFENIHFEVEKAEKIAILGESGIGKSTLLKTLAGFYSPISGEIFFKNKALLNPNDKLIKGEPEMGFVNQENKLFPLITIEENLKYALKTFEKTFQQQRVNELLQLFKINHVANHLPKNCSGGEVQRAVIAQSIAATPPLLLMDEPFSHLDIINKNICKKAIKKLVNRQKTAFIFVTHDLIDAIQLAEKIYFMTDNEWIGPINAADLPTYNKNKYIKKYVKLSFKPNLDFANSLL